MDTQGPRFASVARVAASLAALAILVSPTASASAQVQVPDVEVPDDVDVSGPVSKVKETIDSVSGSGDEGSGTTGPVGTPSVEGAVDAATDAVTPSSSGTSTELSGAAGGDASEDGSGERSGASPAGREGSGADAAEARWAAAAGEVRDPKPEAGDHDTGALISGGHAVVSAGGGGAAVSCPRALGALCLLFGSTGGGGVEVRAGPLLALTGIAMLSLLLLGMGLLAAGTGALRVGKGRFGRR